MRLHLALRSLLALVVCAAALSPLSSVAAETVFFIVRHAEKVSEAEDTLLSADGMKRAEQLKQTLEHLRIDTILHTDRIRTRDTAAPLAAKRKITPTVYGYDNFGPAWTDGLLVSEKGKRVLIIGHSNTLPAIVSQLSGKPEPDIGNQYDNLFVVTVSDDGRSVIRLKYGAGE